MALNITQKFSVDLSAVVDSAISATQTIRRANQAKKEGEFQKAIADGMPYDQQVALRKAQLDEEKSSTFADASYVATLEKSIGDTSKLARFDKYRNNYASTLGDLNSGKINEETYLNTLKSNLNGVTDPELRLEIQNDIATGEKQVKTYHDTILDNQVKKAKYDGTQNVLNDAVSRVTAARTTALVNGNTDEVTAYDVTLSALNSQLTSTKIQDTLTNFQVTSATRGSTSKEKLSLINNQLSSADGNTPIKIGDTTYASAQQYWTNQRDSYLAGTSQVFGDFFKELNTETKSALDTDTVKHGYPTQPALDTAMSTFNDLRSKPEIAPYVSKLDITQASVMANAIDDLAKKINDVGTNNLSFQDADTQLKAIATKYGVNTDSYRMQLDQAVRNQIARDNQDGVSSNFKIPDVQIDMPKVDGTVTPSTTTPPVTTTPATPTTPVTAESTGIHNVAAGDTLSSIANSNGIDLAKLLELNPQYKDNPNMVREGAQITIPKVTPVTPIVPATTVTPPASTVVPPKVVTPPTTTTPPVATTTPAAPMVTPATPLKPVATPAAVITKPSDYVIASGDTLGAIAAKNGTTVDALAKLNNIKDPNLIVAGKTLKLQ